ncbi:hypothetical protein [Paenibacillus sp. FSL R7-0128]|uniref:hypothetical protein n=1 Tax=Paenibacillus sp. FSL R7-0128 TaxID=2954529 RepID=UPI0030F84EFC
MEYMELVSGLPNSLPRHRPVTPQVFTGNLNNINIDRSVIGSVNTGNIDSLDVSLNNIKISGKDELSKSIKDFSEAVLSCDELNQDEKNDVIEQVAFISEEATKPEEKQKKTIILNTLKNVKESVLTVNALTILWEKVISQLPFL